jgi:8-oxo-dGTP pyrophosphatase MutT (NUDIX family)
MEAGETPKQTALREVREESGISALEFPWGDTHIDTGPYSRGKITRYYLARTNREEVELLASPDTGRPEHSEFRWLSFAQASRPASPRVAAVLNWAESLAGAPSGATPVNRA